VFVVIDSNQLYGRLTADRPSSEWQRLLGLSAAGKVELVLPEVVQWELVNQFREELTAKLVRYRASGQHLSRAGLAVPSFGGGEAEIAQLVAEAGERLRQTVLWHRGRIAPVPDVSAAVLVRRSLERRAPFDAEDRGMRDTLLWHTVLGLLREGQDVVLVSADGRAFGQDRLLPALADEVAAIGGHPSRVVLAGCIKDSLELLTARTSEAYARAHDAIFDDDEVVSAVIQALSEGAESVITEGDDVWKQGWPDELVGYRVVEVTEWGGLAIEEAALVPDGSVRATLTLLAHAELDVRSTWLEYNDFEELTADGHISDVGVGLLDGLTQTYLRRDVIIVGEVSLSQGCPTAQVRVAEVRLPRRALRSGQLALELPDVQDFTASW
jgi:hypothetical protein